MQEIEEVFTSFHHDDNGVVSSKTLRNCQTWVEMMQEFVYFLEGIGFTGVRDKVAVDTGEFFTPDQQGWYGPTFDAVADRNN